MTADRPNYDLFYVLVASDGFFITPYLHHEKRTALAVLVVEMTEPKLNAFIAV